MIKSELINTIAQRHPQIPERDIANSINMLLDLMTETLEKNGRVEIRGFGSFNLHYRPPRNAHNPKTRERVITQAKYSPHFKAGKELRDKINAGAKQGLPIKEENRQNDD